MSVKCVLLWLCKAAAAGVLAVAILSGIVLVCNNTGVHITSSDGATDYVWEANQLKTTMSEGYAWLCMDDNGYNNAYVPEDGTEPDENVDILLMGSSHMEALQVAADENTGYLLNELLPQYHTYNIGMSGHTIYTCLSNLAAAEEIYHPSAYTIIETDTVELNTDSMRAVLDITYAELTSYDSGLLYLLQRYVPAAKALYQNVSEWMSVASAETASYALETSAAAPPGNSFAASVLMEMLETVETAKLAYAAAPAGVLAVQAAQTDSALEEYAGSDVPEDSAQNAEQQESTESEIAAEAPEAAEAEADIQGQETIGAEIQAAESEEDADSEYERTLHALLTRARADCGEGTLIVFYHPALDIDSEGNLTDPTDRERLALFAEVCEETGIVFVDMTEPFAELYAQEHQLPHGFINTAVGVGHLNRYGHAVIAQTLANVISELESNFDGSDPNGSNAIAFDSAGSASDGSFDDDSDGSSKETDLSYGNVAGANAASSNATDSGPTDSGPELTDFDEREGA